MSTIHLIKFKKNFTIKLRILTINRTFQIYPFILAFVFRMNRNLRGIMRKFLQYTEKESDNNCCGKHFITSRHSDLV